MNSTVLERLRSGSNGFFDPALAVAPWAFVFVVVLALASSSGGFLATTWGWCALLLLAVTAASLLWPATIKVTWATIVYLSALAAVTAWALISNLWTLSATDTMHEVQRDLAYVAVVAATVTIARLGGLAALAGGALAAITVSSIYGLATRLYPGHLTTFDSSAFGYRLSPPITYWNGLGIFAVFGVLLAIGFVARGSLLATRGLAGACLPPLAATTYFTFSRGAWYSLAVALLFLIALDPRRLQLIAVTSVVSIWPVITILEARRQAGLVTVGSTLDEATSGGHRLAPMIALFTLCAGVTSLCLAIAERRFRVPSLVRAAFALLVAVIAIVGMAGVWIEKGSPATLARRGWSAFHRAPTGGQHDVESRLLSLSANGRLQLWHVSIRDFKASPFIGQGAGTFEQTWVRYRTVPYNSLQSHSLYLGTLGELGLVGLSLLTALILTPLVSAFRLRRMPLVPPIAAAYVAWALHSGFDWDWALVGVTAPALVCGAAMVAADGRTLIVRTQARTLGAAAAIVLAALAGVELVADKRISRALGDVRIQPASSLSAARGATSLAPWSSDPYAAEAGAYQTLGQKNLARRAILQAIEKDPTRWSLWRQLAQVTTGAERRRALARSKILNPFQTGR